jgi:hypothetical protein
LKGETVVLKKISAWYDRLEDSILVMSPMKFLLLAASVIIIMSIVGGVLTAWASGNMSAAGWWALGYMALMIIVVSVSGGIK